MAPEISVAQILALDEFELVQLIKTNRDAEGNITIHVNDLRDISKNQRDQLANRLNATAEQASVSGQSSLDFDELNARLVGIAAETDAQPSQGELSQWSGDERPRTLSPVHDLGKKLETYAYNKLVEDGGWPAYPISSLGQVFKDPTAYHESLQPWLEHPDSGNREDYRQIFTRQREHWREFRRWQLRNRGIPDRESFAEYLEDQRKIDELSGDIYGLADPAYEEKERPFWEEDVMLHHPWIHIDNVREVSSKLGFSEYTVAAARRLADHGFTQPFQFEEDPRRQDKWTTFVEYLGFACWWVDRYSKILQGSQRRYDAAWEELQKTKVLKGIKTEEDLDDSDYQRYREKEQASRVVEAAQASLASTQQRQASRRDLDQAQKKLNIAEESLATITKRNTLVYQFWQDTRLHRNHREKALSHEMRMQWIRGHLSLIEKELCGTKVKSAKKRPPEEDAEEDAVEEQGRKKQKHDQGDDRRPGRRTSRAVKRFRRVQLNSTAKDKKPFQQEVVDTQTSTATNDPGTVYAQDPRRSARIAAAAAESALKAKVSVGGTTTPTPAEEPKKAQSKRKRAAQGWLPSSPAKARSPLGPTPMRITKRQGGGQQRPTRGRSKSQRR